MQHISPHPPSPLGVTHRLTWWLAAIVLTDKSVQVSFAANWVPGTLQQGTISRAVVQRHKGTLSFCPPLQTANNETCTAKPCNIYNIYILHREYMTQTGDIV